MTKNELEQEITNEKIFQEIYIPRNLTDLSMGDLEELEEKKKLLNKLTGIDINEE